MEENKMKRTLITLISVLLLVALVAGTVSASAASPVLIDRKSVV